jgi:16S rRNA (guanine966-N2)-methyltransferase
VLDLFAGSGAMGLEALSRGAARAVFVEADPAACRTIERNLDKLDLRGEVRCADVLAAIANERRRFGLVFCDPPYAERDHEALARYLPRLLAPEGLLVFETAAKVEPELPLTKRTSRRYGAARITLFEP